MLIKKIVSGGQTGADRAGLDWAIWHNIPHGGWSPKGRRSEDGSIPQVYRLDETPSSNYLQRTEWNVRDSDGTVIFTLASKLGGGSLKTASFARKHRKPFIHLCPNRSYDIASELLHFIAQNEIKVLNVAGTRLSKEPDVALFVRDTLEAAFFPASSALLGGPGEG